MIGADADTLHRARGEVAGMVFQEPMTSLNPLHRVGRQVAEAITLHRRCPPSKLRARVIEVLNQAGFADAETPAGRLPASALRRPAPARDDRHGARQRSCPADRRRTDHRARRDDPGADPEAARAPAHGAPAGDAADHPRPADRPPLRRHGLRDEGRRHRRGRHASPKCSQTPITSVYLHAARRGAQGRAGVAAPTTPSRCCRPTT